ncbi:hypothetical protein K474DRAFT_554772 [Panus rudis PR-1116 ss-1]|nr:hypothetical protein K474DRAFT_554772 [Panus rudis PR-1116 ss-1]
MSLVDLCPPEPAPLHEIEPSTSVGRSDVLAEEPGLLSARPRPSPVRRDTDQILSYYQSEHAGKGIYGLGGSYGHDGGYGEGSDTSSNDGDDDGDDDGDTPSDYSSSPQPQAQRPQPALISHTRRPSVPSEGGSDRRRLAIVEIAGQLDSPPSLLSRRGVHVNRLALVAPPDASPKTYTDLTPPPTAPIPGRPVDYSGHQRSASEATHALPHSRLHHKSSRDVGIVGTGSMYSIAEANPNALQIPIFQTPLKSRTPSPTALTPDLSDSATTLFNDSYQTTPATATTATPEIGQGKDVTQPVLGPVVIGLNSDQVLCREPSNPAIHVSPTMNTTTPRPNVSPYVYYQPGVHSTAGPLPPPPKSIFEDDDTAPPPRPPRLRTPLPLSSTPPTTKRDIEALKESLRLPQSVSAALASRSNSRLDLTRQDSVNSDGSHYTDENANDECFVNANESKRTRSIHRREGAFPPSSSNTSPSMELTTPTPLTETDQNRGEEGVDLDASLPSGGTIRLCTEPVDDRESVSHKSFQMVEKHELRREPSWVSLRNEPGRVASPDEGSDYSHEVRRSCSPSPSSVLSSPLPPPKDEQESPAASGSVNVIKSTLSHFNLKRFSSLPRTPSTSSKDTKPQHQYDSRTPSPSLASIKPKPPRPKIKDRRPAALKCDDVFSKKTAAERCRLYAEKIDQLAETDCGLGDWVLATKLKGARAYQPQYGQLGNGPALPSHMTASVQPRHTSHGSMASEMTFPVRADAYTATDLSMRPTDDVSTSKSPPPLPYPSLASAARPPNRTSTLYASAGSPRTYQVPLATGPKSGPSGFFASIGRKASMKKERGLAMNPPSPGKLLGKRLPNPKNNPSPPRPPIQVLSPPTVPGGPRAAPHRINRSQTVSMLPPPVAHQRQLQQQETGNLLSRRNTHRNSALNRRPSLFSRTPSTTSPPASNPEFEHQVDKLADLLPHVERRVLAGYLRRAGQDMLAIGQYLEDEKNGTVRYD